MVDPELLEILVCPETKQALRAADPGLVARINAAIAAGSLRSRAGEPVHEPVEEALVREDGRYAYAVRDSIPIMLIDEAIPLDSLP